MPSMLSRVNKQFFFLTWDLDFSFKKENFLQYAYDINFSYSFSNKLETGIDGNLINLDQGSRKRKVITISGSGPVDFSNNSSNKLYFISSKFITKYSNIYPDQKIIFDHLFKRNEVPLNDSALPNKDDIEDAKNLYAIPIIPVYIKEHVMDFDYKTNCVKWKIILEEDFSYQQEEENEDDKEEDLSLDDNQNDDNYND